MCRDEGTALLVTSHNMLEVERMCERVVFVAGGRIVADGTPADVAATFGHGDLEGVFLAPGRHRPRASRRPEPHRSAGREPITWHR